MQFRRAILHIGLSALLLFVAGPAGAQLTVSASITATGSATVPEPPDGVYQDNVMITASGVLVQEPNPKQLNGGWIFVSSNYSVSVSGSANDPASGQSWTYTDASPDYFSPDLLYDTDFLMNGLISFYTGQIEFGPAEPWVNINPSTETEDPQALDSLGTAWQDMLGDTNATLAVPTNGQAFSVSGAAHGASELAFNGVDLKGTCDANFTITWQPIGTNLTIISIQTPTTVNGNQNTFVSSDTITLKAQAHPAQAGIPIGWAVLGLNGASRALQISQVVNTDAGGISTFTFSPSQSAAFVKVRRTQYTSGSRTPNDPLNFDIVASGQEQQARLSNSGLGTLMQDETDTLRQEYVDFQLTVPDRSKIVPTIDDGTGNQYNVGNYGVQISVALPEHFAAILAAYRTQMTLVNDEVTVPMPASASLTIASGFRNPRRNKAAGSVHNSQGDISRHVLGSALDLVPDGVSVLINNKQVPLQWDDNLYPALCAAASSLGLHVLPEEGCCDIVDCGTTEDHTHVDW